MLQTTDKKRLIIRGVFKNFPLKLLIIILLLLGSLIFFGLIFHEAIVQNEQEFDNKLFSFFAAISTKELITVMKAISFFGSVHFMVPAYCLIIAYFVFRKKYRYALHIAILVISSSVLFYVLKALTQRQRPDLPFVPGITNYSFPSGHSLSIFIFCGIITYIIWHSHVHLIYKWLSSFVLFCFTMIMGISRIILRVHYPTDVLGAFCLGIVWTITSLWLLGKISHRKPVKHIEQPGRQSITTTILPALMALIPLCQT